MQTGILRLLTGLALLVSAQAGYADTAKVFRAGAATSNITPYLGAPIVGGFAPIPSKNVHDELHARCLVLDDGNTKLAIVVCDLLGISPRISTDARKLIATNVEIPESNVLICATHTHSASSALGDRFNAALPLDDYQQLIVRRIADGVARANQNLRPAELAYGSIDIPDHVFNRRWYLKPGTMPANPYGNTNDKVKMNPGVANPNLVKPAGPTDPAVSIIAVRGVDGTPISTFASYSLHYVGGVPSTEISADYFAAFGVHMDRLVNKPDQFPPFVAIMANGTSGDINNVDVQNPRPRMQSYEQINNVAKDIAEKVYAATQSMKYEKDLKLAAAYRETHKVKNRLPDDKMMEWAEKTVAAGPQRPTDLSYIYAQRTLNVATSPEFAVLPLQVLKIGGLCIGTMPCEVFVEIGLEFKEKSAIKPSFLMSLSHGYFGYLPPPHQHDLGGYETWLGTNRLERDASVKMLAELFEMVNELQNSGEATTAPASK